jgi:hypothetical protein
MRILLCECDVRTHVRAETRGLPARRLFLCSACRCRASVVTARRSTARNPRARFAHGRLRRALLRDDPQVPCPPGELDLDDESIAGLAGEEGARAGAGRASRPALGWYRLSGAKSSRSHTSTACTTVTRGQRERLKPTTECPRPSCERAPAGLTRPRGRPRPPPCPRNHGCDASPTRRIEFSGCTGLHHRSVRAA